MPTTRTSTRRTSSSAESDTTTDHEFIRKWVEERGGTPACVKGTGGGSDPGMIRIDFPGWSGEESLQPISWDEWFKAFDDNKLAFLYQDTTKGGEESRFNKLVNRSTASRSRSRSSSSGSGSKSGSGAKSASGSGSGSRSSSSRSSSAASRSSTGGTSRSSGGGSTRSPGSGSSRGAGATSRKRASS
jgi:hypothetical protein